MVAGIRCLTCYNARSDEECKAKGKVVECDANALEVEFIIFIKIGWIYLSLYKQNFYKHIITTLLNTNEIKRKYSENICLKGLELRKDLLIIESYFKNCKVWVTVISFNF